MIPSVLTAMTTPADPVVQQLAGHIQSMAASIVGSSISVQRSDDECLGYLAAIQLFIRANSIAYQTPPGFLGQNLTGQHIKYPRDVLRNRAGTCVDFAILWASTCEAVGLQPAIMVYGGHAFPLVKLPQSGQWLPIESTLVTDKLGEAITVGKAKMKEALEQDRYLVDINSMRRMGIVSLDLPNVSEDFLTKLSYKFPTPQIQDQNQNGQAGQALPSAPANNNALVNDQELPTRAPAGKADQEPDPQPQVVQRPPVPLNIVGSFEPNGKKIDIKLLVGSWQGRYSFENSNDTEIGLKMDGNGRYWVIIWERNSKDEIVQEHQSQGRWSRNTEGRILFATEGGRDSRELDIELEGDELTVDFNWYSRGFYPILSRTKG
jgi:hypothetical protein